MRSTLVFLTLLLVLTPTAFSQEEPAWLVVDRAELLMRDGEFGLAIQSFRKALALAPNDADALFGLGRAYKATGDFSVALDYYQQALDGSASLAVPDDIFRIRYDRADIYRSQRDFAAYERELEAIVAADPPPDDASVPDDLRGTLESQGLDRFLVLYRVRESGSTPARGMLAELLVGLGRHGAAADDAIYAVLQQFTTLIDGVKRRDPTYVFSTVADLSRRINGYIETRDYLASSALPHDLYYLGSAYWGERDTTALAIWRILAAFDPTGTWGARARRQLADPRDEPLLVPTRGK